MTVWPMLMGTMCAVAAGVGLASPVARKVMLGRLEHDWLADELELDHIDPDGTTVHTKSGTLFRVMELHGQSYETKPEPEQKLLHEGRSSALHQVAEKDVKIRLFGTKRLHDVSRPAVWPSPTLQEIGDAETRLHSHSYFIRWFVLLSSSSLMHLDAATDFLMSGFTEYQPTLLRRAEDCCPLTGFLNYLVCGQLRDDLSPVSDNISANIPAADLGFNVNGLMQVQAPESYVQRIISVKAWCRYPDGHLMASLMAVPGELELVQVILPIRKETAIFKLKTKAREVTYNPFGSGEYLAELEAAEALVGGGNTSWLDTQFSIIVRARSEEQLDTLLRNVTDILATKRIVYAVETKGAPICWYNRLPEHNTLLRPLRLFCQDVAAIWPFQFAPIGLWSNPFGDGPTRIFGTETGQAYAFQFHVAPRDQSLGHFLVIAPSGVGKTTTVLHLLAGLTRFEGVRSYIFDSREGARYMVEAFGGAYQNYDKLALNPLQSPQNTKAARARLYMLIRSMLADLPDSDALRRDINHVVNTTFSLPHEHRIFNSVYASGFAADGDARRSFARWVETPDGQEGIYSHLFNAQTDSLTGFLSQAHLVGINMNEALADPALAPPVVTHICDTISETVARTAKGFAIFIDEAAALLENPTFRGYAAKMYREWRKKNGVIGMAFQDPTALFDSGIGPAVVENTATILFYPNAMGSPEAYGKFNLNPEELNFIFHSPRDGRRRVLLVKQDAGAGYRESVILDVDLARLGPSIRFYRSGDEPVRNLLQLQDQWGAEWLSHL